MNLRISQGQAIRSVFGCSRVTHFTFSILLTGCVSPRLGRCLRGPSAAALMHEADAKARRELGRPVHEEFDVVASGEVVHPFRCGNPLSVVIGNGELVEEALEARGARWARS